MHGQPPLQVRLGAHLLQLLACTDHSNGMGAPGLSMPCQKLPVSLLVRAILLFQGFTTWATSLQALCSSMKVFQSSEAASELPQCRDVLISNLAIVEMAS